VIDLHTHTTASDGRLAPAELVARAAESGVRVLAVTDHDTVAAAPAASAACAAQGLEFVAGIEITSMSDGEDVHVLGYFVDPDSSILGAFLAEQRRRRVERVRAIVARLAGLGMTVDEDAIVKPAVDDPSRSVGRPAIAREMVARGYVADTSEAFDRWLARGRPAFLPREAATPAEVVAIVHSARGVASLAHPGVLGRDSLIPPLAASGLDALEAFHSDHDARATAHYLELAARLGLVVTGGSDFHGDDAHGAAPGRVSLPREHYDRLVQLK
jgi:predicted metal-dependent phosphoesterase TrpH